MSDDKATEITFGLSPERVEQLGTLMIELGLEDRKQLANNAFTLLLWARDQIRDGKTIGSIDETRKVWTEVQLPCLEYLKQQVSKQGS